jgi:hypothetical protein
MIHMRDLVYHYQRLQAEIYGLGVLIKRENVRPACTKAEKLEHLVKQLKAKTLDFTFYFMTGKDLKFGKRQGPIVTVALAKIKGKNRYARGIGICHPKDTPNKVDGKIAAAKTLLRALKKGKCFADSLNVEVNRILLRLCVEGLIPVAKLDPQFLVGTSKASLTQKEKKIAAGFERTKPVQTAKVLLKRWSVVEQQEFNTIEGAKMASLRERDLHPQDRFGIETIK